MIKKSTITTLLMLGVAVGLSAGSANAATVLYHESFDGEGNDGDNFNSGTTPEINLHGAGVLQSSGVGQILDVRGTPADGEWEAITKSGGFAAGGMRFGATPGYNWASGANKSAILNAGGFAVSFTYKNWTSDDTAIFGVIVGSTGAGEEGGIRDIDDADLTFGAAINKTGGATTWDNGVSQTLTDNLTAASNTEVEFLYTFSSFDAGSPVQFQLTRGGDVVGTDTFTWDDTDEVKIRLVSQAASGVAKIDDIRITAVPEPSTIVLGGVAILGLGLLRRRIHA